MAKRNRDAKSVKDLLELVIKGSNLERGLKKMDISDAWNTQMGPGVAKNTREVKLQNGTLIVALNSAALREQLSYGKDKIIKIINEQMGEDLVKRLMLV